MKKKLIGLVIIAFLILIAIIVALDNPARKNKDKLSIQGKTINVEIVNSPEERRKGLMFRDSLCSNCGMLFIFDREEKHSFWMKNTYIPLDMIFIDSEWRVVDILQASPCNSSDCRSYLPSEKAKYVLEVNQGTFNDSVIGEEVLLERR